MLKKVFRLLCPFVLLIAALAVAVGCNSETAPGSETGSETNHETESETLDVIPPEDLVLRYEVVEREGIIPMYDWYRIKQRSFDGKGVVHWSNTLAERLNVNWINVFPSGKYKTKNEDAPGAFLLDVDRIIEYTAYGLKESHEKGIRVITSAPMVEMFDKTWIDYGYDPDLYKVYTVNGKPIEPNDRGISYACNNNALFQEILFSYTEKVAKAGFDGCLYDGFSYSHPEGYYCQCPYCKALWKEYSLKTFGKEIAMPVRPLNMEDTELGRAYLLFRLDLQAKLYEKLRAIGKQYVPHFEVYMNTAMHDLGLAYYYMNGIDVSSSEFKHAMGRDSALFLYELHNSLTDQTLVSFVNLYTEQIEHQNQYYTSMAEAFATGNAMCHGEVSRTKEQGFYLNDTATGFGRILTEHKEAFTKTASAASTAVLYSWQDTDYMQIQTLDYLYSVGGTNIRETFDQCSARRVSVYLAREGIPFRYITAETNPTLEELLQVKVIILPELKLLDKELEETLLAYVKAGGELILTGTSFATHYLEDNGYVMHKRDYDVLEAWTGTPYRTAAADASFTVENGKIHVCKKYEVLARDKSEKDSKATDAFLAVLSKAGAGRQVIIESQLSEGYVETTLRTNAYGTNFYLHLIHNNTSESYQTTPYDVSLAIPEEATVTDVSVCSPYYEDKEASLTWEVKDGRLLLHGDFHLYSMVTVTLTYVP
ncbi:MAG: hypothetical protein E7618_06005 [Ruminococcaceae bacterium]|nr:hypothetical protein [Oscillospiraceae bacterium]